MWQWKTSVQMDAVIMSAEERKRRKEAEAAEAAARKRTAEPPIELPETIWLTKIWPAEEMKHYVQSGMAQKPWSSLVAAMFAWADGPP